MRPGFDENKRLWDERADLHPGSEFYDISVLRSGGVQLDRIEIAELGDVEGKDVLHLQCHFGIGTISLSRLGANATGVDFSPRAVEIAEGLAVDLDDDVDFTIGDATRLRDSVDRRFDVVFSSYGVLCWLDDLAGWAEGIRDSLRPGGRLVLIDGHPIIDVFEGELGSLRVEYDYFTKGPMLFPVERSYTGQEMSEPMDSYEWMHPMSEIVNSLIGAGMRITSLNEYPLEAWERFEGMEEVEPGLWSMPEGQAGLPLLFALQAERP